MKCLYESESGYKSQELDDQSKLYPKETVSCFVGCFCAWDFRRILGTSWTYIRQSRRSYTIGCYLLYDVQCAVSVWPSVAWLFMDSLCSINNHIFCSHSGFRRFIFISTICFSGRVGSSSSFHAVLSVRCGHLYHLARWLGGWLMLT